MSQMISERAYPPAGAVAPAMHEYFVRLLATETGVQAAPLALLPSVATIEGIVDAAFWASLRREEGYIPKISLAFVRPEQTPSPLLFQRPLSLSPASLSRLAPAVERPGIHLGVWEDGDHLSVWGTTREIPTFCFVLEVVDPGLLVVKHRRSESGKFVNVLVLQGDEIKIVDETALHLPDCPKPLNSLLGFHSARSWSEGVNALVELAVSMRAHHRGGALLVVPSDNDGWRDSIVQPMAYPVVPPFLGLAALMREGEEARRERRWQDELDRAIAAIAGLTAVDGATIISDTFALLAFGAKISRLDGRTRVQEVIVTEPIEGSTPKVVHPSELGGTRHLSAAQFAWDQRDAVVLVASQDGHFTTFAWSPYEERVHAHRVESLLL